MAISTLEVFGELRAFGRVAQRLLLHAHFHIKVVHHREEDRLRRGSEIPATLMMLELSGRIVSAIDGSREAR